MKHAEVIEKFLSMSRTPAKGSRMFYRPETGWLYSFGEHFPLASIQLGVTSRVVLLPDDVPTATTSKHRHQVHQAARRHDLPVFFVNSHLVKNHDRSPPGQLVGDLYYIRAVTPDEPVGHHRMNLSGLTNNAIAACEAAIKRHRPVFAEGDLARAVAYIRQAREYAEQFSLQQYLPPRLPQLNGSAVLRFAIPNPPRTRQRRANYHHLIEEYA